MSLPELPKLPTKVDKQTSVFTDILPIQNLALPGKPIGREYDLNDLEVDTEFQTRANRFLSSIGEEDGDIFEYMRDADFNLVSAMKRYSDSGKFTDQQKEDYNYLRTVFDGAKVGSADQIFRLIKDGAVDMLTDPTLLAAALFTPFTGGGSLVGRTLLGKQAMNGISLLGKSSLQGATKKQLVKAISDGSLDEAAKNATKLSGALGSLEVGGFLGLHNHANQNIELNTGLRKVYSNSELAKSIGTGLLLGGGIGIGGQVLANRANPVLRIGQQNRKTNGVRLAFNKAFDRTLGKVFLGNARRFKDLTDRGITKANEWSGVIDHDSQLRIGKRNTAPVKNSFPEKLQLRRGDYMFGDEGLWRSFEKIAPDGTLPVEQEIAIIRFLRGKKSALNGQSKEVKDAAKGLRDWLDSIARDAEDSGFGDIRIKNYFPREWDRHKIRNSLISNGGDGSFQKKLAKDLKISDDEATQIVEGMLDINNQMYASHGNLLTHKRKLNILDDNNYEDFLTNDLVDVLATYGLNAANVIQVKRTLLGGLEKKVGVRKAIDTEGKEVTVFEGVKQTNRDLFEETWIKPIEKEVREKLKRGLSKEERASMYKTFESMSGQVTFYQSQIFQGLYDGIKLANSLAYLPLATASSASESLIASTRPGTKAVNNFLYQLETGLQFLTSDMKSVLTRRRGLSDVEANREANKVFLAVDDIQVDKTNRLAGEGLQTGWAKNLARDYFKLNTLLSWTKNVELAAFRTGRDIVTDSLEALKQLEDAGVKIFDDADTFLKSAQGKDKNIIKNLEGLDGVWTGKGNLYKRTTYLKETLFDLGIDPKEGLTWLRKGANTEDRYFQRNIGMAGSRFARSVILPTSREFSKVPRFMTNPRFDILTQFLRYPTAFSNTVIKNYVRDTLDSPIEGGVGFGAFVVGSMAIARGTNYWRGSEEAQNYYDQYARKPATSLQGKALEAFIGRSADENYRALQRVGLLGQYEWIQRAKDSYTFTGSLPSALVQSFGGPVIGDVTGMGMYSRGPFEVLARKAPLIGTRTLQKRYLGVDPYEKIIEGAKEIDDRTGEAFDNLINLLPGRERRYAGGVIKSKMKEVGRMQYNQGSLVEEESVVDITVDSLKKDKFYRWQMEKDYKKGKDGNFVNKDGESITADDKDQLIYTGDIPVNKEPGKWVKLLAKELKKQGHPFPEIAAVQSGFESRYGMSDLSTQHNNIFGVKDFDNGVMMPTTEDYGEGLERRIEPFAVYNGIGDAVRGYINFVNTTINKDTGKLRYANAINATTDKEYIEGLKQGGYATDPKYVDKIYDSYVKYKEEGLFD